jgi:hypothetical protein
MLNRIGLGGDCMEDLLAVFVRAREALSHPDNDFAWSSWRDADDGLREIDGIIAKFALRNIAGRTSNAGSVCANWTNPRSEPELRMGAGLR